MIKYLRKTKAEMLEMGDRHGIFKKKKARDYLYEVLLKKRNKFQTCTKKELLKVFQATGSEDILKTDK